MNKVKIIRALIKFKMWTSQGDDIDQKHTIKLNPIFEKIGYFGKFQILQLALVWTTLILGSCASFKSYAFTGYMPKYRCLVPQCEDINTATYYSKVCKPKCSFNRLIILHSLSRA